MLIQMKFRRFVFLLLGLTSNVEIQAADIQVTTTGAVVEINAGSIFLTGTASGAPEATTPNSNTGSAGITTNIITLTDNAWLIDVVGSGNGGSYTAAGAQTERWDASASSATGASSTKPVATAGLTSMTQTHSTISNRTAHGVVAVAPAAASTIAFDSQNSATVTGSNTLSWTHNPVTGSDTKLIVGIAIEDNCTGNEVITGVTYGGVPLTQALSTRVPVAGFCQQVEMWYLDITTAADIEVTTTGAVNEINAGSIFLTGTASGAPEATAPNSNTGSASITTNIITLTDNAWLIDVVGSGNGGSFTAGGAQTERWDVSAASGTGASSTKSVATAGMTSMTQTHSTTSNRNAHGVIAVAPAAASTIAFDSQNSATGTGSNTLNWTHSPGAGSDIKLIVGIAIEDGCTGNQVIAGVTYGGAPLTQAISVTVPVTGFCQQVEIWYLDLTTSSQLQAYLTMDETWTVPGAGVVLDNSGNGNDGDTIAVGGGAPISNANATPAVAGTPGTCGYGVFPLNTSQAMLNAVDSTLTPGDSGAVTFWYRNDAAWAGSGNRKLLDASMNANNRFFLTKMSNGSLRFRLEVGGTASQAQTAVQAFPATTWVHIGITWNLPGDRTDIYINGASSGNSTASVGTGSAWNTLYVGDNRASLGGQGNTGRSAGGQIDEVRIYGAVVAPAQINSDLNEVHSCVAVDHYEINHDSTGVSCLSDAVTITAIDTGGNPVDPGNVTVNLSVAPISGDVVLPPAKGNWARVIAGTGNLTNVVNDGTADFEFLGDGTSAVTFAFNYTQFESANTTETINFDVDEPVSGTTDTRDSDPGTDPDLVFALAGFQFYNETSGDEIISTQIAAKPSDVAPDNAVIALRAIRVSDSDPSVCVAAFPDLASVTIPLGAECRTPAVCAGNQITVTNNSVTSSIATNADNGGAGTTSYSNTDLLFQDDGTGITRALIVLNYPDAGEMQVHARYEIPLDDGGGPPAGSGGFMTGSSQSYVVRPFGFAFTNIDAGGTPNPGSNTPAGAIFAAAGSDFEVVLGAYRWVSGEDSTTPGIPDTGADITDNGLTANYAFATSITPVAPFEPASGTLGSVNNGAIAAGSFTAGQATVSNLQYTEVGSTTLQADAANYLGDGNADITGDSTHDGGSGVVGRFTPFDFSITLDNVPLLTPGCSAAFTYLDQPFNYATAPSVTITARNALANTTNNYDGAWWKLADFSETYTNNGAPLNVDDTLAGHVAIDCSADTCDGAFTTSFSGPLTFVRAGSETAPFGGLIDISFSISDGEASYASNPFTVDDIDFSGGNNEQRWGMLAVGEEVGSELMILNVPLSAEYYDGAAYILNSDDNCTAFTLATHVDLSSMASGTQGGDQPMVIGSGTTSVTSGNPTLVNGSAMFTFTAPGADNKGIVDIEADLTAANMGMLLSDWDGDGNFDNHPAGRATFGIISRPKELIYSREPW